MESEIYAGAPCLEPPRFVRARRKSWAELRQVVRDVRCRLYHTACKIPASVVFCRKIGGVRIYFLCSVATGREMTLHFVDVNSSGELSPVQTLFESKFHSKQSSSSSYARSSKEEQLQLERKRVMMWGITAFDYVPPGHFAFTSAGSVFRCRDQLPLGGNAHTGLFPEELRGGQTNWTRLEPQLCPFDPSIVAYVANNDIWVYNFSSAYEFRLTSVHEQRSTLSAGVPCYVTQEEFNRFSGFWWAPQPAPQDDHFDAASEGRSSAFKAGYKSDGNFPLRYSILYEIVDEAGVGVIELPNATGGVEKYHFPRAGTPNAKSSLRVVTFSIGEDGNFVDLQYWEISNQYINEAEYVIRAGWTPDSRHVWTQLLNRQQDTLKLVIVKVHPENRLPRGTDEHFTVITDSPRSIPEVGAEHGVSSAECSQAEIDTEASIPINFDDRDPVSIGDPVRLITNAVIVLHESSSVWINAHDVLIFLPSSASTMSKSSTSDNSSACAGSESEERLYSKDSLGQTQKDISFSRPDYCDTSCVGKAKVQRNSSGRTKHERCLRRSPQSNQNLMTAANNGYGDYSTLEFIWASEVTGFRHLYLYRVDIQSGRCVGRKPLTGGEWEVSEQDVWVDASRRLVYFIGLKDSPLEKQLYVVGLDDAFGSVRRLTSVGASHQAFVSSECDLVVTIESSLTEPPFARLYRVCHLDSNETECASLSSVVNNSDTTTAMETCNGYRGSSVGLSASHGSAETPSDKNLTFRCRLPHTHFIGNLMEPAVADDRYRVPELFKHQLSSGDTVYGVIFKPVSLDESRPHKFPTVLTIYGGPQVQLVTNSFKGMRHLRQHLLASEDFCVVTMDCRGSRNRGIAFESHLRGRMGQVEIQDQVEVLQWLAEDRGYMDMSRVAIHGWSYGGYLSLMALAQRPDIFKVAVAGAPVTQWNLYDTGYTERYMGLPDVNREGYHRGSVLSHVSQFPDEDGRLLLIHGLMDENVHFVHTTLLIQALVKAGKPYRLQVYPQERHSLRHLATSEHYETTLLSFLQDYL